MGKANKTKGAPFWYGKAIPLSENQRQRLTEDILGIDTDNKKGRQTANKAIQVIELLLGGNDGAVQSINLAPRAANFLAELQGTKRNKDGTYKDGLRRQAYDLMNAISSMSYWMQGEFEKQGCDVDTLAHNLAKFQDTSRKIEEKYEDQESRGTPKSRALRMLVNTLRKVFEHYYATPKYPKKDQRTRSGKKKAESMFIRECLSFARITCPDTDEGIQNLYYSADDAPEETLYFNVLP